MIRTPEKVRNERKYGMRRYRFMVPFSSLVSDFARTSTGTMTYSRWPSYRFCCQDFRLAFMWWQAWFLIQGRIYTFFASNHHCSCPMCNQDKRRYQGNSQNGKPFQELRIRLGMDQDMLEFEIDGCQDLDMV